ncbi:sterol carrier family protein [Raineyella sp.]|uniref:sterol carrier family protein n=1 Tax=Raineyella sp. TaxID=1911550 RepID=UPI002B2197BB|nr:sterol carrier family protein [Raineyella sp.]MEA5154798.1 sterol carrier family protein [Raineyella sp.]
MTSTIKAQRRTQKLRRTFAEALRTVADVVVGLTPAEHALPIHPDRDIHLLCTEALRRLTEVRGDLHLSSTGHSVARPSTTSPSATRPTTTRPVDLERYAAQLRSSGDHHDGVLDTAGHDTAGHDTAAVPAEDLVAVIEDLVAGLLDGDLPPLVDTGAGQLSLLDFLRVQVLEIVLFHDDLARVLGQGGRAVAAPPVEATASAVRTLADILAARAPGKAIEVRIPPYAAVQIGDPARAASGVALVPEPAHTRGTPPAIVETDATTFLRVMSGRLDWADAVARHAISASGLRTDLSPLLPLVA